MPDIQKTQDAVIEIAKDLLMLDLVPLLDGLDASRRVGTAALPIRFASAAKTDAFYKMTVAFHAAHGASEEFRKAHVSELTKEKATWWTGSEIPDEQLLSRDDIERRRAS